MRYLIILLCCMSLSYVGHAQDKELNNEPEGGFHKENLFTGGSVTVSLSSYGTVIGADPVLGYSVNSWLDAGVVLNFAYYTQKYYDYNGLAYEKDRQLILGPGVFMKLYPARFLFVQAQYERNTISDKTILYNTGQSGSLSYTVPSFLAGIGYCGGREGKGSLYYYISVLADFAGNYNSPYLYHYSNGTTSIAPIFRVGMQIPLFQGGHGR